MLHVTLLQQGVQHVEVDGRYADVHISADGHNLSTLGAPEINLQMAPEENS